MFKEECMWIGSLIPMLIEKDAFPLLNVGSSTLHFRTVSQPYISKIIFDPLAALDKKIIHLDLKAGDGVDIFGDLNDPQLVEKLKGLRIRSALCSNMLEHVEKPEITSMILYDILQPDGVLIVTVPFRFPYHEDPIDTMLRPTVQELSGYFPNMRTLIGKRVESEKSYFEKIAAHPKDLFITLFRWVMPFYKPHVWWRSISYMPYFFKKYSVSCIVLQK
jgi:hypothetical protein